MAALPLGLENYVEKLEDEPHSTAICLPWMWQHGHALLAWFGREAEPSQVSGGKAATSVCAGRQWGGPRRSNSCVPFRCGSLCHLWSQCVCTGLNTSGERAHPKPNAFPFPWEKHFASYFSLFKVFQYHIISTGASGHRAKHRARDVNPQATWDRLKRNFYNYENISLLFPLLSPNHTVFISYQKHLTIVNVCGMLSMCQTLC